MITFIPETAPFSPAQRAWLSGFFAGALGLDPPTDPRPAPVPDAGPTAVEPDAKPAPGGDHPWHDETMPMDERMKLAEGRPLQDQLMAAMAQQDCGSCGYVCHSYAEAIATGAERNTRKCVPGGRDTAIRVRDILRADRASTTAPTVRMAQPKTASPAVERTPVFRAELGECRRLNGRNSGKETCHVSIDVSSSGVTWEPGDILGVHPRNSPRLVSRILEHVGASGDEFVTTPMGGILGAREALASRCDLGRAPDELMSRLRLDDVDADEEDLHVCDALIRGGRHLVDIAGLVSTLHPLEPRLYSIASSARAHPDHIHLTVGVVRYRRHGRGRDGTASTYLTQRVGVRGVLQAFLQRSHGFRLPSRDDVPVIMIGPGTGVAPFLSFIQQRAAAPTSAPMWLFFGDRRRSCDFLYQPELTRWRDSGVLSRLSLAFSRDQEDKIYVQHRMLEEAPELWSWLNAGSHLYVCGDASKMAPDVDRALHTIIAEQGGMDADDAAAWLADARAGGRYQRDVY